MAIDWLLGGIEMETICKVVTFCHFRLESSNSLGEMNCHYTKKGQQQYFTGVLTVHPPQGDEWVALVVLTTDERRQSVYIIVDVNIAF